VAHAAGDEDRVTGFEPTACLPSSNSSSTQPFERVDELNLRTRGSASPVGWVIPVIAVVTCARIHPLLALVTPRSRYLKKSRRPLTKFRRLGARHGEFHIAGCVSTDFSRSAASTVMVEPPSDESIGIIASLRAVRQWLPKRPRAAFTFQGNRCYPASLVSRRIEWRTYPVR